LTAAYPANAVRTTSFSRRSNGDIDRAYRAARRHSWRVRWLRRTVLVGIAAAMLAVVAANYLPSLGAIRLPGELGKLVLKGTKITMEAPKINGFTSDGRPYEFVAQSAAQDITKPDILELKQVHATIRLADQSTMVVTAPRGIYQLKGEMLTLLDNVVMVTSTGYEARMTETLIDTRKGNISSDKPIWVKLLNGFVNAKRLDVVDNGAVLRFTNGVSMTLYSDHDSKGTKQQ